MDIGDKLKITLGTILIVGIIAMTIISIGFSMNNKDKPVVAMSRENYQIQTHTIDSLTRVVDSLQTEIFAIEDGFDFKEHRYEDVVFEYELGLSYLKDYHPKAYKDFHRIIAHKERYSHEVERENTKILNQYKTE
jgi:hypothetical protein